MKLLALLCMVGITCSTAEASQSVIQKLECAEGRDGQMRMETYHPGVGSYRQTVKLEKGSIVTIQGEMTKAGPRNGKFVAFASHASYPNYGSYMTYSSHPLQMSYPSYGSRPSYGSGPSYGSRPSYGSGPSYGSRPSYGSGPSYGSRPSYGSGPSYGSRPSYNSGPDYSSYGANASYPYYESYPSYESHLDYSSYRSTMSYPDYASFPNKFGYTLFYDRSRLTAARVNEMSALTTRQREALSSDTKKLAEAALRCCQSGEPTRAQCMSLYNGGNSGLSKSSGGSKSGLAPGHR